MKYLIWGTGYQADVVYQANCDKFKEWNIDIVGFIDNHIREDRRFLHDIRIYAPEEIVNLEYDYIDIWIISSDVTESIKEQIRTNLKIPNEKIRNVFSDVVEQFALPYKEIDSYKLPSMELFSACIDYYKSHQWYKYIYRTFERQKRSYYVYEWIKENLDKESKVLDIACGGGELLWYLRQEGYRKLSGFDIDETSVQTAKAVNHITHGGISFFMDDAIYPQFEEKQDVFIWMTGMYLLEGYSLEDFFEEYVDRLNESGYLIFEMVDTSYNEMPMNEFHTQDWKSEGEKRPSEYRLRLSEEEVINKAKEYHLSLRRVYDAQHKTPLKIYVFQKQIDKM